MSLCVGGEAIPFDFLSSAQVFTEWVTSVGVGPWCWGFAVRNERLEVCVFIQDSGTEGRKSVVAPCRCPRSSIGRRPFVIRVPSL